MASITKKGDRKYLIRVSKGTGKGRTYDNRVFRGTLADARTLARQMESDMDGGIRKQSHLLFEDYLRLWLAAIAPKVAPRTLDGYEGYITRYALKPLAKFKLADIRNFHIQQIYLSIGKAPGTVRQLHASLNACFAYAIRREYIRQNPCRHLDLPQREHRDIEVLTADEIARFTDIAGGMRNGLIFMFALQTGMRPEEYLALRWSDISGRDISIQQAVQFNRKGGGYYFKALKTQRSRRRIDVSESLRQLLQAHKIEQNLHRLAMKSTWFHHGLVFPNEIGRPFAINNLTRRHLKPILDKCDFPKHVTLYSLRHTCATMLLLAGVNPKVVADRLGHSSVVITLDTYSHVLPSLQADATELINQAMRMKAV
jgi:integrase